MTTLADAAKGDRLPSLDVTLAFAVACGAIRLAPFQPETADRFFGRERFVDELVARLASRRFLAVVGSSVSNLAFGPDRHALITGHGDGTARIARCEPCVPIEEALRMAENRITRDFTPQERKAYLNEP